MPTHYSTTHVTTGSSSYDYFTAVLGFSPSLSQRLTARLESEGGLAKLKKVDPSQGAGVNGKAQNNVSKGSLDVMIRGCYIGASYCALF